MLCQDGVGGAHTSETTPEGWKWLAGQLEDVVLLLEDVVLYCWDSCPYSSKLCHIRVWYFQAVRSVMAIPCEYVCQAKVEDINVNVY